MEDDVVEADEYFFPDKQYHSSDEEAPYHDDFEGQSLKKLSAYYFPNNKSVVCFSVDDDDGLSEQNTCTTEVPAASNVSDLKAYVYTNSKVSPTIPRSTPLKSKWRIQNLSMRRISFNMNVHLRQRWLGSGTHWRRT
jgi:hypothetical protein